MNSPKQHIPAYFRRKHPVTIETEQVPGEPNAIIIRVWRDYFAWRPNLNTVRPGSDVQYNFLRISDPRNPREYVTTVARARQLLTAWNNADMTGWWQPSLEE